MNDEQQALLIAHKYASAYGLQIGYSVPDSVRHGKIRLHDVYVADEIHIAVWYDGKTIKEFEQDIVKYLEER